LIEVKDRCFVAKAMAAVGFSGLLTFTAYAITGNEADLRASANASGMLDLPRPGLLRAHD
jgi:hypothetical protein